MTVVRTLLVATAAAASSALLGEHHGSLAGRGHHGLCGLRIANVARVGEALSANPDAVVDTADEGFGEGWAGAKGSGPEEHVRSVDRGSAGRVWKVDESDRAAGLLLLGRAGRLLLLRRRRNLRGCGLSATCSGLGFTTDATQSNATTNRIGTARATSRRVQELLCQAGRITCCYGRFETRQTQ